MSGTSTRQTWPRTRLRALRLALACATGALAFALALEVTEPVGPGLDPDASSYLGAARSFVATGQFRVPAATWASSDSTSPLRHFPPGLSLAIAVPMRAGLDAVQGARLVNAAAAFVTATVIVLVVAEAASLTTAVVAALLALVSSPVADVHLNVLSEPLFLACLALTLAAMMRRRPLVAAPGSGLAAAAAVMVRYAGIAAGAAASLWMLLDRERERRPMRRLRNAVLAGAPTAIAMGAWVLHNRPHKGEETIRTVGVYGGWSATLRMGLDTARAWLAPSIESTSLQGAVATVVLGLAMVVATLGGRALRRTIVVAVPDDTSSGERLPDESGASAPVPDEGASGARRLLRALALLAVVYAVVIGLSRAFADPKIPFDERILSPLVLLAIIAFTVTLGPWWRRCRLLGRATTVALVVLWAGASLGQTMDHVDYAVDEGSDFANTAWRESELMQWIRDEGQGRPLFSNWPEAIYLHTGRPARELPTTLDPTTVRLFGRMLARRHAVVVGFDVRNKELAQPDSLAALLGLHEVERVDDGAVWEARGAGCEPSAGRACR